MKNKENLFDQVPVSVVKSNLSFFLPLLSRVVNLSLSQGIFPDELKHALVSPMYKASSNDSEVHTNCRPLSNLPFVSNLPHVFSVFSDKQVFLFIFLLFQTVPLTCFYSNLTSTNQANLTG